LIKEPVSLEFESEFVEDFI